MLVFDDLHWADEMSLEVIGELARHAPTSRRSCSSAATAPTSSRPTRSIASGAPGSSASGYAEEVRLQPLTLEETAIATTLILGGELPAPRDVVEAVHERTNGIPLHIEELLGGARRRRPSGRRRIREAHVPDTIGDAVLARLARLSDEAAAGRPGRRGRRPLLQPGRHRRHGRPAAGELEPTDPGARRRGDPLPVRLHRQGYYDFRHQLLRDAIYGAVPPSQLRRFHAQAAEFVMPSRARASIHASRHYERAGLRPQAFRASLTAAARGEPDLRPPGGLRAVPAGDRQHAARPAGRRAGGAVRPVRRRGRPRSSANEESFDGGARARELYLEAGRPLDAAGDAR